MPTLSVFMPNYNHGRYLPRAIEAVAMQSRRPDQFLIIDDASTDDSVAVIKQYQQQFPFITLIQRQSNQGLLKTMQEIPSQLTGDYVFGAAADDYVLPGFFEQAMQQAEQHPQVGIIFGRMVVADADGNQLYVGGASRWPTSRYVTPKQYLQEFLEVEPPGHALSAALIYRKEPLVTVGGFRPELGAWCDVFAARAAGLRHGACYIAKTCAVWTTQPNSTSQTTTRYPREMLAIIQRATTLMRSPEFRQYFPEKHVRRWANAYRRTVIGRYVIGRLPYASRLQPHVYYRAMQRLSASIQ